MTPDRRKYEQRHALRLSAARPRRQGPRVADLSRKFGSRYSTHPGSYWLTFARRLDGDQWSEPIEVHHSDGLLDHRPVLLPHAGRRPAHRPQHRRPLHHAGDDRRTTFTPATSICPASRSSRSWCRTNPARRTPKLVDAKEAAGGQAHPRLSHRGGRQEVSAAARRVPSPHRDFLGRRPRRLAGGHVPLRHRRGRHGLDRQRRPRQRRRPRILLVADAEVHRRLPRQGPLHADVHLRTQRVAIRTAIATACSPSAASAPCRAWPSPTWRSASPASTPTTPRCSTAT